MSEVNASSPEVDAPSPGATDSGPAVEPSARKASASALASDLPAVASGEEVLRRLKLPERFSPRTDDPIGRGLLAFLSGYFCCLCSFEWTMIWSFAPYAFRPLVALLLSAALLLSLLLHQLPRERRAAAAIPALTWIAVAAWPLKLSPITATLAFSTGVLVMLLGTLRASRAGIGLVMALAMALSALAGFPIWPLALLSSALGAWESLRPSWPGAASRLTSGSRQPARARLEAEIGSCCVEISWKGFASLFKAAAPGEGERFVTTLLADTATIIEAGQGRRIRGSDLNGTYRFPSDAALDGCLENLERYRVSVLESLASVKAPPLKLLITHRTAARTG